VSCKGEGCLSGGGVGADVFELLYMSCQAVKRRIETHANGEKKEFVRTQWGHGSGASSVCPVPCGTLTAADSHSHLRE